MRFLNRINHVIPLFKGSLNYIKKCQMSFQKVIKEAIKWDNDRFIMPADNKNISYGS